MNRFGGDWTKIKMEIVVKYAKAYLEIMKTHPYWHTMYFDALAGSGEIEDRGKLIEGTAIQIMSIDQPRPFDSYYFVDNDEVILGQLREKLNDRFPNKTSYFVKEDCNQKIKDLSKYLNSTNGKNTKVLAYFDPFGMQINWKSIVELSELNIDVWMLVPSGIGVNRLLKKTGEINEAWQTKLESFLGLGYDEIHSMFYKESAQLGIFGESDIAKIDKPIQSIIKIYQQRLGEVFQYISTPLPLKNSRNSIMYHFLMMTNNATGLRIANDIISKYQ